MRVAVDDGMQVECFRCGTVLKEGGEPVVVKGKTKLNAKMNMYGWAEIEGEDYCPKCFAKHPSTGALAPLRGWVDKPRSVKNRLSRDGERERIDGLVWKKWCENCGEEFRTVNPTDRVLCSRCHQMKCNGSGYGKNRMDSAPRKAKVCLRK